MTHFTELSNIEQQILRGMLSAYRWIESIQNCFHHFELDRYGVRIDVSWTGSTNRERQATRRAILRLEDAGLLLRGRYWGQRVTHVRFTHQGRELAERLEEQAK